MASRGKSSKTKSGLSELINAVRANDECWPVIRQWADDAGHDRANAILVAALLEQSLEDAIITHLKLTPREARPLLFADQEGGLSNFAMKIKLAYALGIVEESIKAELTKIKNIRNVFAHTRADVTFQTPEIADACNLLQIPQTVTFGGLLGNLPMFAKGKYAKSIELIYLYLAYELEVRKETPVSFENSSFYYQIFLNKTHPGELAKALMSVSETPSSQETSAGRSLGSPPPGDPNAQ